MNNLRIRTKLLEKGLKYYHLDEILGISEPTRCRWMRKELPEEEQERICNLIDEYTENEGWNFEKHNRYTGGN